MELKEMKQRISGERIMNVARKIFQDRGYTNVRIADIARAAECSVGSVYNCYESKEKLFLQCFDLEDKYASVDEILFEAVNLGAR